MFTQMVQEITQTVREVHLTVFWQEGTQVESIDLVTHVVSLGPGSDRNGGFQPNQGSTPGAENQWVDPDNGRLVASPVPGPDGKMIDPATGKTLMRRDQWLQNANAGGQQGTVPGAGPGGGRGNPLQNLLPRGMQNMLNQGLNGREAR
jgi:general secretion pathway protein I